MKEDEAGFAAFFTSSEPLVSIRTFQPVARLVCGDARRGIAVPMVDLLRFPWGELLLYGDRSSEHRDQERRHSPAHVMGHPPSQMGICSQAAASWAMWFLYSQVALLEVTDVARLEGKRAARTRFSAPAVRRPQ